MNSIEKYQTAVIGGAVGLGLLIGQNKLIGNCAEYFIVPFLMIMLFGLFLNIPINDLLKSFSNLKFVFANIGINFVWTPLLAYGLGYLFLQNQQALWIGLVMLTVTPCTDWYLIFTETAKGNTPLSTSILPLNLFLQVIFLPIYLLLFFGRTGSLDSVILFESILLVLIVPFTLAQILKYSTGKCSKTGFMDDVLIPFFGKSQVVFLSLAILAMFASQGNYLVDNLEPVSILLVPLLIFFVVNFFFSRLVSSLLKFNYQDSVSLNFTTLARNSPISLAIAVTLFPDQPLVALALVIGPLIELPILALVSQILLQIRKRDIKQLQ